MAVRLNPDTTDENHDVHDEHEFFRTSFVAVVSSWLKRQSPTFELIEQARRGRKLLVERLAVFQTPSQELRPRRHHWKRVALLGQESPQLRMMPTELMS